MNPLIAVGRLFKAKPFLGVCIVLLGVMLSYRELYHREQAQSMRAALAQADAEAEAREIAAERRYQHLQQQAERLEQRNQELARRHRQEQQAITEINRMNEIADELVRAKLQLLEELKGSHAPMREPVPAAVVELLKHTAEDHGDRP